MIPSKHLALCALLLVSMVSATTTLATQIPPTRDSDHAAMLDQLGVRQGDEIHYRDEQDQPIAENDFFTGVAKGHSFSKSVRGNVVTLTIGALRTTVSKSHAVPPMHLRSGDRLPPFAGVTLTGRKVTQAELRGSTTLVSLFFAQCAPCIAEVPLLNDFAQQHKELRYLALTFDDRQDALEFSRKRHFAWPIVPGQEKFLTQAEITAYPVLAIIGPDGAVKAIALTSTLAKKGVTMEALDRWYASHR